MFGYELARSLEAVPPAAIDEFQMPALAVGLYDVVVAFDHQHRPLADFAGLPETDPAARRERAAARSCAVFANDWPATPTMHQ